MQKPLDLGTKIIDAANIHAVKPLTEDRTAGLNTEKAFTAEIRAIGSGGYVESQSVAEVVERLRSMGEHLKLLPTGEAVRVEWIVAIKNFTAREGAPNKFGSAVELRNPATGEKAQEWFAARPEQILGFKAPGLAELAGGPKG